MLIDETNYERCIEAGSAVRDTKTGRCGSVVGGARASGRHKARLLVLWEGGEDETRVAPFGLEVIEMKRRRTHLTDRD